MDIYLALGAIVVFCVTLYLLRDRIKSIRLGTQGLTIELDDKTEAAKAQAQAIGVSMADRQSIKVPENLTELGR